MTAEIVQLPPPKTIAEQLREIADAIESGEYGITQEGVLVLNAGELEVFGLSPITDATSTHYLLGCAMSRLQAPMIKDKYK
jgi:hypothetical protein